MPFGILDVLSGLLTIIFGTSRETSDFIADCLQQWWDENRERCAHIRQLVINLDNGPENSSFRTQFMQRMKESESQRNCFRLSATASNATRLFPGTSSAFRPHPLPGDVLEPCCFGVTETSSSFKENGASLLFSFKVRQTGIFISGTCLKPESRGKTGYGVYADGMVEHDAMVGQLLDKLKELGIEDNTIVMYSTDNGAEVFTWPDGGTTMFAGEKATQWEGGFRVPTAIRWPGVIKPGTVINDICAHEDMLPTLLAAAGDTTVRQDLLKGRQVREMNMNYKVHLDGYNLMPFLKGEEKKSPREEFLYWTDDGNVAALRYNDWKITFMRQNAHGMHVWQAPYEQLRMPMVGNLRTDPFERAHKEGIGYGKWQFEHMFAFAPAGAYVGKWLESFKEFPPRQKPGSFSLERVLEKITKGAGDK